MLVGLLGRLWLVGGVMPLAAVQETLGAPNPLAGDQIKS
jgi:hypothetical protein